MKISVYKILLLIVFFSLTISATTHVQATLTTNFSRIVIDAGKPSILDSFFGVETATNGQTVIIYIDIMPTVYVVTAGLYNELGNWMGDYPMSYNSSKGYWEAEFVLYTQYYPNGIVYLGDVYVEDGLGFSGYLRGDAIGGTDFISPILYHTGELPVILGAKYNVTSANVGDTVNITADIYDPSGVVSADCALYNYFGSLIDKFDLSYNPDTMLWEASFVVLSPYPDKTLYFGNSHVTDSDGNSGLINGTVIGGHDFYSIPLKVVDVDLPQIIDAWFGMSEAYDGDIVQVSADIYDPSGVVSADFGLYDNTGKFIETYSLEFNVSSGNWEGSFYVIASRYPDNVIYWGDVLVSDWVGNSGYLNGTAIGGVDFVSSSLTILTATIPDTDIPTILQAWFDVISASDGELVHVFANIYDISGVKSASYSLYSKLNSLEETFDLAYNSVSTYWEGSFEVNASLYSGVIYWGDSHVSDLTGNSGILYGSSNGGNDFNSPTLMISDNPPSVTLVQFDKSTVNDGNSVKILVDVLNDMNINSITASLYDSKGNFVLIVNLIQDNDSNVWLESFTVDKSKYSDNFIYCDKVTITDSSGNSGNFVGTHSNGSDFTSPSLEIVSNDVSSSNDVGDSTSSNGSGNNLLIPNYIIYSCLLILARNNTIHRRKL